MDEPPEGEGPRDDTRQEDGPRETRSENGPSTMENRPGAVLRETGPLGVGGARPAAPKLEDTGRVRVLPPEPDPVAWRIILQTLHPGTTRIGLNIWQRLVIGRLDGPDDEDPPGLDMSPHRAAALGVSRRHAALIPGGEALFLVDLNSTNGTWVNGTYLPPGQRHPLKPGDRIELGLLRLIVRTVAPLARKK